MTYNASSAIVNLIENQIKYIYIIVMDTFEYPAQG